jgi:hypothetical protein
MNIRSLRGIDYINKKKPWNKDYSLSQGLRGGVGQKLTEHLKDHYHNNNDQSGYDHATDLKGLFVHITS